MSYAEAAAERVLNELPILAVEELAELELLAWARGALVREEYLEGAEARIAQVGRRAIITVSTGIGDPRRRRFGVAHELGHLELHRKLASLAICSTEDIDNWLGNAEAALEREANEFAAALLMPERFFVPLSRGREPSLNLIGELADTFNTSLTATAIRYIRLSDEPVVVIFSKEGHIRWFWGSQPFEVLREELRLFIDVRSRLDSATRAAMISGGQDAPSQMKQVPVSAWFTGGRYRAESTLLEQSVAMPTYGAILSILWIPDDIEDDEDEPDSTDDDDDWIPSWRRTREW